VSRRRNKLQKVVNRLLDGEFTPDKEGLLAASDPHSDRECSDVLHIARVDRDFVSVPQPSCFGDPAMRTAGGPRRNCHFDLTIDQSRPNPQPHDQRKPWTIRPRFPTENSTDGSDTRPGTTRVEVPGVQQFPVSRG
jgi:hypothetical protein